MKHYIEITLLPNAGSHLLSLWSKVFQQIHLGLVELADRNGCVPIGLSFPEYVVGAKYSVLGSKCRLFSDNEALLVQFNAQKWLAGLSDSVHCSGIRLVPETVASYATYQRLQPKVNKARLARRYAKRHNVTQEQALTRYEGMASVSVFEPFIRLKSLSTDKTFCLWIKKTIVENALQGGFSSYGLSAITTVPDF